MVAVLPEYITPNGQYNIKQTSAALGISRAALYNYDRDSLIRHELRPENGRRVYRGKEIIRFHGSTDVTLSRRVKA